jgi:hypothetical protein
MRALFMLSLLALIALPCQVLFAPALPNGPPSGSVLFQDDFSDPSSGWARRSEAAQGSLDYTGGVYRILVSADHLMLWSGPGLEFTDLRLEVDAMRVAGPEDDDYGFVCRSQDPANFYFLAISSDGYYGIGKVVDGVPGLIHAQAMAPNEAIRQGNAQNHLRADCIGEQLSLYANGTLLARVEDPDFRSGEAGLMAGTLGSAGTEVYFDNFTVIKP